MDGRKEAEVTTAEAQLTDAELGEHALVLIDKVRVALTSSVEFQQALTRKYVNGEDLDEPVVFRRNAYIWKVIDFRVRPNMQRFSLHRFSEEANFEEILFIQSVGHLPPLERSQISYGSRDYGQTEKIGGIDVYPVGIKVEDTERNNQLALSKAQEIINSFSAEENPPL